MSSPTKRTSSLGSSQFPPPPFAVPTVPHSASNGIRRASHDPLSEPMTDSLPAGEASSSVAVSKPPPQPSGYADRASTAGPSSQPPFQTQALGGGNGSVRSSIDARRIGDGHEVDLFVSRIVNPQPFGLTPPADITRVTRAAGTGVRPEPASEASVLLHTSTINTISLGETLRIHVAIQSDPAAPLRDGKISVDVQNQSGARLHLNKREWKDTAGMPNGRAEMDVSCEMKELGMTVITITIGHETGRGRKDFARYFKFNVTTPFAIKTKSHLPSSPNAILSPDEREKVYLEVHIQNTTPEPILFSKVALVCVPSLEILDHTRPLPAEGLPVALKARNAIQNDQTLLLQPGNIRQHLFVLRPTPRAEFPAASHFPPSHPPGQVLPLGRLDLGWTSSLGESGQLLTSVLTRRAPAADHHSLAPPPRTQLSIAPANLERHPSNSSVHSTSSTTTKVRHMPTNLGPQLSRLARSNLASRSTSSLPQTKSAPMTQPTEGNLPIEEPEVPVDLDLIVRKKSSQNARCFEDFAMSFRLAAKRKSTAAVGQPLHLAVQYLTPYYVESEAVNSPQVEPIPPLSVRAASTSSPASSRPASPLPYTVPHPAQHLLGQRPRSTTPVSALHKHSAASFAPQRASTPAFVAASDTDPEPEVRRFPPYPVLELDGPAPTRGPLESGAVDLLNPSLVRLPTIELRPLEIPPPVRDESPRTSIDGQAVMPPPPPADRSSAHEGATDFEMVFLPLRVGLAHLGGLRVLLLNDPADWTRGGTVLREWLTVGDVWIED